MKHCGVQYLLQRGFKVPERPSWALIGGSAFHKATEIWDGKAIVGEWDNDPQAVTGLFHRCLDAEIQERLEREPDFTTEDFRPSGRASKEWPNKEDEKWWRQNGPAMVMRWITWRTNSPWEIVNDDVLGVGIELEFSVEIGGVVVKGGIDRLMHQNYEQFLVLDLKSGREPDDKEQLGTYGVALQEQYGLWPQWGTYWMGRTGSSSEFEDMRSWPKTRLDYTYSTVRSQQARGEFLPKRSAMCSGCSVRDYCLAVNGEKSDTVPAPWEVSVEFAAPKG